MILTQLQCPRCGCAFEPVDERRVYVCDACQQSYAAAPRVAGRESSSALQRVERAVVRPQKPLPDSGRIVLLPVWFVPIRWADLNVHASSWPQEVRLPAMGLARTQLLIKYASHLTRAAGTWEILTTSRATHAPAELDMEDAFAVAELVVFASVEGWPRDDEADRVEVPLGPPRLLDLPCHLDGRQLTDLVFGRSQHFEAGDGLADQREEIGSSINKIVT